jgi:hypothetical protein
MQNATKSPSDEPAKARKAADNRARFPFAAAIADELKIVFGEDQVKLIWAREGDNEVGNLPEEWRGS